MNLIRGAVGLALVSLTAACTSLPPGPFCPSEPGGWCADVRDAASQGWRYAQIANNAYQQSEDDFTLPGNYVERYRSHNDGTGFAYAVYDRFEDGRLAETILSFRGTEWKTPADWIFGNILGRQNRRGLIVARELRRQLDESGSGHVRLTVTGHSLGGRIAHQVALQDISDGAQAHVHRSVLFDVQTDYWDETDSPAGHQVDWLFLSEQGEILSLRKNREEALEKGVQTVNCLPGFHPFLDHSMTTLADCLTWIAAFDDGEGALLSLSENPRIVAPPGQMDGNIVPPGLPEGDRRRPVNLYAPDGDYDDPLFKALLEGLEASPDFAPRFGAMAGLSLSVERDGAYHARWRRNGAVIAQADCKAGDGATACASAALQAGTIFFAVSKD